MLALVFYYIGISIVFFTHFIKLILEPFNFGSMATQHNIINLVASFLIAYYFLTKEKIIKEFI